MKSVWVALALLPAIASCDSGGDTATSDTVTSSADTATSPPALAPGTDSPLPESEVAAIVRLGATGAGPPPGHDHSHGGGGDPTTSSTLAPPEALFLDYELDVARSAIPLLDTVEEVAALGYVKATVPSPGIGTHWVKWSLIEQPFDPAAPSMVLFDYEQSPPKLVGYSYALSSPDEPVGFTGESDMWHRHTGLCVALNGWVIRERAASAEVCDGSFIAGGDFWMLHTWMVPGWENRDGMFAPMNPTLCPAPSGTPDFMRCPDEPQL